MLGMQDDISDIELKQRWRLFWIQSIFEFSSLELQERLWIKNTTANQTNKEIWESSYDECISAYFDTLGLYDAYEKALEFGNVSQEELKKVSRFHTLAAYYEEPSQDPQDILKDPEWLELVTEAKEFWKYLKANLRSQRERQLINKLEKEYQ